MSRKRVIDETIKKDQKWDTPDKRVVVQEMCPLKRPFYKTEEIITIEMVIQFHLGFFLVVPLI